MRIRHFVAGAGVAAVALAGFLVNSSVASAATDRTDSATSARTPAAAPLSCPPGAPYAWPGCRCLSWYPDGIVCRDGINAYIGATPATDGYCKSQNGWWGYVNH